MCVCVCMCPHKVNSLLNKSCLEDNIKLGIQEVGLEVMDWIALAEDRDR